VIQATLLFKHAWRTMYRQRLRSILSATGIVFAVVSVMSMLAIGEGARQQAVAGIEELGIRNVIVRQLKNEDVQLRADRESRHHHLTMNDVEILRRGIPQAAHVAALYDSEASTSGLRSDTSVRVYGVTSSYAAVMELAVAEGRWLSELDEAMNRSVGVVGQEVWEAMGALRRLRVAGHEINVIGVFPKQDRATSASIAIASRDRDRAVFQPIRTVSPSHGYGAAGHLVSEIIIACREQHEVDAVAGATKRVMKRHHGRTDHIEIIIPLALQAQAERSNRTFLLVMGAIAAISLIVGGIGVMNIMLANVAERTKELGIRRAIGATRTHIVMQITIECLIVTSMGAVLGAVAGVAMIVCGQLAMGWPIALTTKAIMVPIMISGAIGVASSIYPAWNAAMVDPNIALRAE